VSDLAVIDPREVVAAASDPAMAVVALLGQARSWLAEVQSIDDASEFMAKADALRSYTAQAKLGKEAEHAAFEIWTRAERRIGELLGPAEPGNQHSEPSHTDDGSFSRDERYRFRKLAAIPEPEFDERVEQAKESGRLSRSALLGRQLAEKLAEKAERERQESDDREWERRLAENADTDTIAAVKGRSAIVGSLDSLYQAALAVARHGAPAVAECIGDPPAGDRAGHLNAMARDAYLRAMALIDQLRKEVAA